MVKLLTCSTFSARRISPRESFKSADFPSSVIFTLREVGQLHRGRPPSTRRAGESVTWGS